MNAFLFYAFVLIICQAGVFYFFTLSSGMKRVFLMLVIVEMANWFTEWSLVGQVIGSILGLSIFLLFKRLEKMAYGEEEVIEEDVPELDEMEEAYHRSWHGVVRNMN